MYQDGDHLQLWPRLPKEMVPGNSGKWFHEKATQNWNIMKQLTWHKYREYVHLNVWVIWVMKGNHTYQYNYYWGGGAICKFIVNRSTLTTFTQVKHPTKTKHRESTSSRGFFCFKQRIYFLLFLWPLFWITCSCFGTMYPQGFSMSCELLLNAKKKGGGCGLKKKAKKKKQD